MNGDIIKVGLKSNANFLFGEMKGETLGGVAGGIMHASIVHLTVLQFEKLKRLISQFGYSPKVSLAPCKNEDIQFSCFLKR